MNIHLNAKMLNILKRSVVNQIQKCHKSTSIDKTKKTLGIIGVPFHKGQKKLGVDDGPKKLRDAGLLKLLEKEIQVVDHGDIRYNVENIKSMENMTNLEDVISCNKTLHDKVKEVLQVNDKFLVLGGDHSIALGSIGGHLSHNPNIAVIWVDAHADININTSSKSGSIHGMPLSLLLEELKSYWAENPTNSWLKHRLPAQRLAYIGLRDIDQFEVEILKKFNICAFGMDAIDKFGIGQVMKMCLNRIDPQSNLKYHLSLDVDALDPCETPSTGTPVPLGLTLREALYIMETIADTKRLIGMDLVEINPQLGTITDASCTIKTSIELVKAAFGLNSRIETRNWWTF